MDWVSPICVNISATLVHCRDISSMVREVPIRREWEKRIDQDIYQKSGWNMLHISLHTAAAPVLQTVDR